MWELGEIVGGNADMNVKGILFAYRGVLRTNIS